MQMSFNQWQLVEKGECSEVWQTAKSTGELFYCGRMWFVWVMGDEAESTDTCAVRVSLIREDGKVT